MNIHRTGTLYAMGIHWQELVILLLIVLLLFGPKRLPEIGRSMGSGIREFRESFSGKSQQLASTEQAPIAVEVEAVEEPVRTNPSA